MSDKITVITGEDRHAYQKQLLLYAAALRDIDIAIEFFDVISKKELLKISDPTIVGQAYAFYITYGRIFHKNNVIGKVDLNSFKLTNDEQNLHGVLMNARNKVYSHNDPENIDLFIYHRDGKLQVLAQRNFHYLADHKEKIASLLNKIKQSLDGKTNELLEKLYSVDDGYAVNKKQSFVLGYSVGIFENPVERKGD